MTVAKLAEADRRPPDLSFADHLPAEALDSPRLNPPPVLAHQNPILVAEGLMRTPNPGSAPSGSSRVRGFRLEGLERVKGIEPSSSAWKAVALPLSYTRAAAL
jgi:hypothetical protein